MKPDSRYQVVQIKADVYNVSHVHVYNVTWYMYTYAADEEFFQGIRMKILSGDAHFRNSFFFGVNIIHDPMTPSLLIRALLKSFIYF